MSSSTRIKLYKKQMEFFRCEGQYPAIIGGFGSGKSYVSMLRAVVNAISYHPGLPGIVVAPTYKLLEKNNVPLMRSMLDQMGIHSDYNETKFTIKIPRTKSEIWCYSAERPENIEGPTVAWGCIDEATLIPRRANDRDIWQSVISRVRHPERDESRASVWISGTARGKGKNWVKSKWRDNPAPGFTMFNVSTYDNKSLPSSYIEGLKNSLRGDQLRVGLYGEFVDSPAGALWQYDEIEKNRISLETYNSEIAPHVTRTVVGVDPAVSCGEDSDETGIIVASKAKIGGEYHYYILEDKTQRAHPRKWAGSVISAYFRWSANFIAAEKNQGGDLVETNITNINKNVPVKLVHASKAKHIRADPVAILASRGYIHHVGAGLATLEDQLCEWEPDDDKSPDRLDAMVYAVTEMMTQQSGFSYIDPETNQWVQ